MEVTSPVSNDVSIDVQVRNLSGAGFTDVDAALTTLKATSKSTAKSLKTLTTRSGAAATALDTVKASAGGARTALEELRAQASDVTVKVTVNDDTQAGADAVKAAVDDLKTLGPVTLNVNFDGSTADITATKDALKGLKDQARDTGLSTQTLGTRAGSAALKLDALALAAEAATDKLEHLRTKAAETALVLATLRTRASSVATALGSVRDRAHAASGRVETLGTHTQTLTTHLTSLHTASTTASAGLAGLRGRVGTAGSSASGAARSMRDLTGALIGLAPALVPIAAQLGPIAAGAGAATLAMIGFGAAVIPQIKALGEASKAQKAYSDATKLQGKTSTQALAAEAKYQQQLAGMGPASRKATAAFIGLKEDFVAWSDSVADFTLDPVVKSFGVVEGVLPKLTPLAKSASSQLSRLMTLAGGEVSTPGFDRLMDKLDRFTNRTLRGAGDEVVHFSRLISEGRADGPISKFMDYARSEGPHVKEVLADLSTAVGHIVEGMADAGPSMLTAVDALARLVSAVPPEVLGRLMQLYTAFKLIKLSSAGLDAVSGRVRTLAARLTALRGASTAAGGGLRGVRAAFSSLSTKAKIGGTIAVIAAVAVALKSLQGSGKAAPDVDRLTTSLGQLGRTGKVTGEAARVFGGDFSDLNKAIDRLNGGGSKMDHFNDAMNKVFTLGHSKSNSLKDAEKQIDAVDDSLANMVQSGNADLAAAAVAKLSKEYAKTGKPTTDLTDKLDDYKSALADAKFEQDLTADSMGLFGKQALVTQKQLAAQKQSADGLRQSIQALNQVNRDGIDAQSDFEQAIDDATAAIKGHHGVLRMVNGELDLNSKKARDAYKPLSDLAAATDAATAAARDQGKSWGEVNRIYDRGRDQLIKTAAQMGLTREEARKLADQILRAPDKTARLKGDITDLKRKVAAAKKELGKLPSKKTAKIRGDAAQLKDVIRDAQARINKLKGKSIIIRATTYYDSSGQSHQAFHEGGDYAHGGVVGAASGGPRSRMTLVGERGPELVDLAAGSRVHTANETRQILAPAAAPAGPMYITLMIGDKTLGELLVDPLRQAVASRGGIVQAALGRSR